MNVTDFILTVRRLGSIPDTGATGSEDPDILALADDALRAYLLPKLLKLTEDYFVLRQRDTLVVSTTAYRVPARALFNKLSDVYFVDSSGYRQELDPVSPVDLPGHNGTGSGSPNGYLLEGNYVTLIPDQGSYAGFIEFSFFQRPGKLVTLDNSRRITAFDPVTRIITLDSTPPVGWTTSKKYDVHSQHSGAELKLWDAQVTGISPFTFSASFPIDGSLFGSRAVAIDDYVTLATESVVPALPEELHGLLARATALAFAESAGFGDKAQIHSAILDKYFKETEQAMETRIEGKPICLGAGGFLTRHRGSWPTRRA